MAEEALKNLAIPSREEEGCIRYIPRREGNILIVDEEWRDQEALDRHMETPHFQAFVQATRSVWIGAPEIKDVK
ncbi:MAG: hypothetical protein A3E07_03770 [Candidatus Wildermuthbacteria bacterium RIFCSPHIGHO2_12_FULL_45_9]|uniref:ABM domain-containing protein n=1 Tax=Candidatus Wildermuthbacteria bacterium RIFCSPHIGHO2_02_FULL_45_25 TaxID=1802450 RepID=A0A1G2R4M2_9BACT|nr:MAG: hypothetical protein A2748_01805 [Candidatus Wildermuthbacteria bacterium RIFCSPHIGHO2_01_FULL_45_20]OHA67773.1 MAG: hypothetical protein A3C04_03305 [Candidatus Wildermuthbacteria bacterium RIFCSPHIGHO2_02_FULL_45_25]OHA72144.1 MAG: hypothetical protein A3E07_03770 [Candidatus Wildermuthbacteria bacterium RIFCSPHIGHO2_12_FULL_45_9]